VNDYNCVFIEVGSVHNVARLAHRPQDDLPLTIFRPACIILSASHRNEVQKLSSAYNIFPAQSRNIDIKRAVWSSFVRLFTT